MTDATFQSALPTRGAMPITIHRRLSVHVSIRAPHAGSDRSQ